MNNGRNGSNARHQTVCHPCRGPVLRWIVAAWPIIGACALTLLTSQVLANDNSESTQLTPAPDNQSETQRQDALVPQPDRKQILQALRRFKQATEGNWRVSWDEKTGLPRMISGGLTQPYPGTPRHAAEAFLGDYKSLYGLDQEHYTLRHFETRQLKTGHRVIFVQQYKKLDVANARLLIMLNPEGRIIHTATTVWPVRNVEVEAKLTGAQATRLVEQRYAPNLDAAWTEPQLAIYPQAAGRLTYLVSQQLGEITLPWEFAIDAVTGELLEQRQVIKDTQGKGAASKKDADQPTPRQSRKPIGRPAGAVGPPPDPCDREWTTNGPAGDTSVTETGSPTDPYEVQIRVGLSNFGSAEGDLQTDAVYGAGMTLLPCIEYSITFDWNLSTWDSYSNFDGFWDVFFVHANSVDFYWNIVLPFEIADLACSTDYDPDGFVDLPGPLWTFGGLDWGDGILCSSAGNFGFTYQETDSSNTVFLSVGLDTGITGDVDGLYPSWGTFNVQIDAQSHIFDPNPVTALNDNTLTDQGDINGAVPSDAYEAIDLTNLNTPAGGQPWLLTGDYCKISDKPTPPGEAGVPFTPPTSRNDDFPYIRDCDAFEAVMAYDHITRNQVYIQGLGFANVNNRQIEVDPHSIVGDNSFYIPDGAGTGYVVFGDGGTDDAEDADVIIHEYGHSIQDNQNVGAFDGANDNGFGDETGAIGEAFGDYWTCSTYNAQNQASGFNPALFAEWDAPPNGLRNLANNKTYPTDMGNGIHLDGEIWSGALWDIFQLLGKAITDTLVLESHFVLPNNPDFADNAVAVLFADLLDYAGANQLTLANAFVARGIFQKLTVQSSPEGAPIDLDITDVLGNGAGNAEFIRFYTYNQAVTLSAPAEHNGENFSHWTLNGAQQPAGDPILAVTMDEAQTALAMFGAMTGDLNGDGMVGAADLLILLGGWGACADCNNCPADLDGDCAVGASDLLILLANWG